MDIFFQDPSEIPLPPEEVRIRALSAEVYPDGRRVLVQVEVDPFQRRPSVDITLISPQGEERASTSILESPVRQMEMTLHLRGAPPPGEYRVTAELFYMEEDPADKDHPEDQEQPARLSKNVTDRAEVTFINKGIP